MVKLGWVMASQSEGFLIGSLLGIPLDALGKRVEAAYAAAGFTDLRPAHSPVFRFLAPEGDRVADLARRAGTTKQAMGYLVDHLEARGYVERVPDPADARAKIIRLTDRGRELSRTTRKILRRLEARSGRRLGQDQMNQLRRHLIDFIATLRQ